MEWLIWAGAVVSLCGVAGLGWCIARAVRARRAGLDGAAMKAALQRIVLVNMGALAVSALGLMMVIIGIALG